MNSFLLTSLFLLSTLVCNAKTFYVKLEGSGTGKSWKKAASDLNAILSSAEYGDEIWVAKGTYYPTKKMDRTISFLIPDGVKIFGGFKGNELVKSQRNWRKHKTVLSGAIGSDDFSDNSHTVVYFRNVSEGTLLDGLVIAHGCANEGHLSGESSNSGGGIYNYGAGDFNFSHPVIKNCIFINNYAIDGGAVYNNGMNNGMVNPMFINCVFQNNQADSRGGAFLNNGRKRGQAAPKIKNCIFKSNQAGFGGGLMNLGIEGEAIPVLMSCTFEDNVAYHEGGAIYNSNPKENSVVICNNCTFEGNSPQKLPLMKIEPTLVSQEEFPMPELNSEEITTDAQTLNFYAELFSNFSTAWIGLWFGK